MSEIIDTMVSEIKKVGVVDPQQKLAQDLVKSALDQGVEPSLFLSSLTKKVVEAFLEAEMTEHLGYEKYQESDNPNSRNGTRSKTVFTNQGAVEINVPRDSDASFEPKIVKKRQRRLTNIDEMIISLVAHGMTTGEISAHFEEIYGTSISKETISRITDKVLVEMNEWIHRPLDKVYPVIFIDAMYIKVKEGTVANRPFYNVLGVNSEGERDVLGIWAGETAAGEGAKYWLNILTELKNRGIEDICMIVCDGLKGLPDAITTVFPQTVIQTCIVHLIRNSGKYCNYKDIRLVNKDLKPLYSAINAEDARLKFTEFSEKWGKKYPAIIRLWENAGEEFIPFLAYEQEVRKVIYTTNAIESLNARYRKAVKARGHFPNAQAALKYLYLVTRSLDPTGKGQKQWIHRWKPALQAFEINFPGRIK